MDEKVKRTLQVVLLIAAFLGFVAYALFYVWTVPGGGTMCPCTVPVTTILIAVALSGLFVGSLIYYLVSKSFFEKKEEMEQGAEKVLEFLDEGSRKVIQKLVDNGGEMLQSDITKETDLSRVKVSRIIKDLSQKGTVEKKDSGVSNRITLDEEMYQLLSNSE